MNPEKIKITSDCHGYPYWEPLMPIVEFCLERGCELDGKTPEKPFFEDRNGSNLCLIVGDVTIKDIKENFWLPQHIETKSWSNIRCAIVDTKYRSSISITSFAEFEEILKERKANSERRKVRLLESRKRRAERDKLGSEKEEGQ